MHILKHLTQYLNDMFKFLPVFYCTTTFLKFVCSEHLFLLTII